MFLPSKKHFCWGKKNIWSLLVKGGTDRSVFAKLMCGAVYRVLFSFYWLCGKESRLDLVQKKSVDRSNSKERLSTLIFNFVVQRSARVGL